MTRRERASRHAIRQWTCPICQKVVLGNGGKSSHKRKHVRDAGLKDDENFKHSFISLMGKQ